MTTTAPGRAQKLCESRGGRPGLPVPDKPDGFCGRKATLKQLQLRWWYCLEPVHTGVDRLVSFQARWWIYLY